MRVGFYQKLALDGIRKNKRMYLPYIITCIAMVMMDYIIFSLHYSDVVGAIRGGDQTQAILGLGAWVIAIFSCIFLFYTNSFLIKGRKKEFGLYNIFGMEKRHIGFILFWENLMIALGSIVAGLGLGMLLAKLAELGLFNMIGEDVNYNLTVSMKAAGNTAVIFAAIFFLLFLNCIRQVSLSSVVDLMKGGNVGEKPPKANWVLGILGVIILGVAYFIAVSIQNPITAIFGFFIAVVMVIVATYMIMIAGSVLLCKILQKNKKYYYKANHFVSVSSMAYRMKRNGAGLASICILATMVLVMISSTASLYFGNEDALNARFPREYVTETMFISLDEMTEERIAAIHDGIVAAAKKSGIEMSNVYEVSMATVAGALQGTELEPDQEKVEGSLTGGLLDLVVVNFMPLSDYNRLTGKNETLEENEVFLFYGAGKYKENTFTVKGARTFDVKRILSPEEVGYESNSMEPVDEVIVIVKNLEDSCKEIKELKNESQGYLADGVYICDFDTGLSVEEQTDDLYRTVRTQLKQEIPMEEMDVSRVLVESREVNRADFYSSFGGLFYLGILLSIVFIIAAVLIIYYKQISEGYEDQAKFDIMKKVGMTDKEIRSSINSQLLTVFYLPLVMAGLHVCFAFPLIMKLLKLFSLTNATLFAAVSLICFALFGVFYAFVYKMTTNAYFNIVSNKE